MIFPKFFTCPKLEGGIFSTIPIFIYQFKGRSNETHDIQIRSK